MSSLLQNNGEGLSFNVDLITKSILLASSITYKSKLEALFTQISIGLPYKDLPYEEWLLYKNLAGISDDNYNEDMSYSINGATFIVNKTNLEDSSNTYEKALYHNSPMSVYLLSTYRNNISLIKGLTKLGSYTPSEISNKEDGTILHYDETLVEWNELSLIPKLEKRLKVFIREHSNPSFMLVDNSYVGGLSVVIRDFIIKNILSIRLGNVDTEEANSYHQDLRANSNLFLGENTNFLTLKNKLWLYRNINDIIYSIGLDGNIGYVVSKLINPSGYKVFRVKTKNTRYVEGIDAEGNSVPVKRFNPLYLEEVGTGKEGGSIDLPFIYSLLKSNYGLISQDEDKDLSKLFLTKEAKETTKYLYIEPISIAGSNNMRKEEVNIASSIHYLKINDGKVFNVEIDRFNYALSGADMLDLFLYAIWKLKGGKSSMTKVNINSLIMTEGLDKQTLLSNVFYEDIVSDPLLAKDVLTPILDKIFEIDSIKLTGALTPEDVKAFIDNQLFLGNYLYIALSSINNAVIRGSFEVIIGRLYGNADLDITLDLNAYEFVSPVSFDYNTDWLKIISSINSLITGSDLSGLEEQSNKIKSQSGLLNKLSSYTVRTVSPDIKESHYISTSTPTSVYGTGLISIKDVEFDCIGAVAVPLQVTGDEVKLGLDIIPNPILDIEVTDDKFAICNIEETYVDDVKVQGSLNVIITVS